MEVEIISTQYIKPSSPTLEHLKIHRLSLLDQFVPSVYTPMILFYLTDDNNSLPQRLHLLKQSLSHTLTRFYPFAGTIKDNLSIDCNDHGIPFSEAKSNCTMFHLFNQPNLSLLLHKLFPIQLGWNKSYEGANVAMIQVTSFTGGGLAIGAIVSHMVADGAAVSFFLKSWSAMARNTSHYAPPSFDAPLALFPQNTVLPREASFVAVCGPFLKEGKSGTRRLGFRPEAISKLKVQAFSLRVPNPTRVEVVSALIWRTMISSLKAKHGLMTHSVNLRRRANPSFPESYMRNFLWAVPSSLRVDEEDNETKLPNLVIKLRGAISKVNSDFVKSLEGEGGSVKYSEALKEIAEEAQNFMVTSGGHDVAFVVYTSWCRFGLYDVDFGWGKPTWVTCVGSTGRTSMFFNSVVLMDTPSGDGLEAWVNLEDHDMTIFEQDKEILAFATIDPNPLYLNTSESPRA